MIRVRPSFDLLFTIDQLGVQQNPRRVEDTYQVRSVKVAKCRLLTTHRGVCCWVS